MNLKDSYFYWPNGTLCKIDRDKITANGYDIRKYEPHASTIAEVVVLPGNIRRLWWPALNRFESWNDLYLIKLTP